MIELKKVAKRGNKWCVIHCTGPDAGKPIKCFPTKEQAEKMHRAIQANKSLDASIFYTDKLDFEDVETKDGKNFFVTGYISTFDKDLVDDIVTPACMSDMMEQLRNRNIKIDVEHESFRGETSVEKEINKTIIPIGRIIDATMNEKGIWIKAVLNKAHQRFKEVSSSVKEKFLDAFSIAYVPMQTVTKNLSDGTARLLDKVNLLNVALTGNPVNPNATMGNIFTKSLNSLIEIEEDTMDIETKPEDARPPKAWWESCTSKAKKFATDEDKFCGWLWQQSGGTFGKLRQAFGKSGDIDVKDLEENIMAEEKIEVKDDEAKKEEAPENGDEQAPAAQAENGESHDEKAPEEKSTEKPKEDKSVKELKSEIEALKKEVQELKSFLKQPQYKGLQEDMKPELAKAEMKAESKGPMDLIV